MADKIVENTNEISFPDLGIDYYIKDTILKVRRYQGSLQITDVSDALRTGKICVNYSLSYSPCYDKDSDIISDFLFEYKYDIKKVYDYLDSLEWMAGKWGGYDQIRINDDIVAYKNDEKAIRVFSPFNLKYMKPLKELPKKWNIRHVLRLIVNGQYKDFQSDMQLTDDYAYDNATNYGKGAISNGLAFAKKVIESPSGWWVSNYKGGDIRLSFNCHHFDYNSLKPVIK